MALHSVDQWVVNLVVLLLTIAIVIVALAGIFVRDFEASTIILTLGGIFGTIITFGRGNNGKT